MILRILAVLLALAIGLPAAHASSTYWNLPAAQQPVGTVPDAVPMDQGRGCQLNPPVPCQTVQTPSLRLGQPLAQNCSLIASPFQYQECFNTTTSPATLEVYVGTSWTPVISFSGVGNIVTGPGVSSVGDCATFGNITGSSLVDTSCFARSVTTFGAIGDNITDNKLALNMACAWAVANNGALYFPPGEYYEAGPMVCSFTTSGAITIVGPGGDIAQLRAASGQDGIDINTNLPTESFHIDGMTFLAGGAASGNAIKVTDSGSFGYRGQSSVTNNVFRGSDGYLLNNCWANDFATNYFSNINFTGNNFVGCSTNTGNGINLTGGTNNGVIYNVNPGNNFIGLVAGVYISGNNIQGVAVTGPNNFTQDTSGILVASGLSGLDQLTVTGGNQFGYNTYGIQQISGVANTIITSNFFNTVAGSEWGVYLGGAFNCAIQGNTFQSSSISGTIGVEINTVGTYPGCVITGNSIAGYGNGVQFDTNANGNILESNNYHSNTTNFTNTNLNNVIKDQAVDPSQGYQIGIQQASITGATETGDGHPLLTVASTSGFVTGMIVAVSCSACGVTTLQSVVVDKIQVSGNTIKLLNTGWSGAYTSGGTISTIP